MVSFLFIWATFESYSVLNFRAGLWAMRDVGALLVLTASIIRSIWFFAIDFADLQAKFALFGAGFSLARLLIAFLTSGLLTASLSTIIYSFTIGLLHCSFLTDFSLTATVFAIHCFIPRPSAIGSGIKRKSNCAASGNLLQISSMAEQRYSLGTPAMACSTVRWHGRALRLLCYGILR